MWRRIHPTAAGSYASPAHEVQAQGSSWLRHKLGHNKFQSLEITQRVLSDSNVVALENSDNKTTRKSPRVLNSQWVKEEIMTNTAIL